MTVTVRPARAEDVAAIDALLRESFPAPDEATLVRDLCMDGDMVLTLVAQDDAAGVVLSFVLGEPDYYGRFGYDAAVARNFASPYAGDYFMALPLQGGLVPCGVREEARHAPAFARLGV